jgi:hypothetical protein
MSEFASGERGVWAGIPEGSEGSPYERTLSAGSVMSLVFRIVVAWTVLSFALALIVGRLLGALDKAVPRPAMAPGRW